MPDDVLRPKANGMVPTEEQMMALQSVTVKDVRKAQLQASEKLRPFLDAEVD